MGGYFPGPAGIATFGAIKFVGYSVAALALKKIHPGIFTSVMKIAGLRTGLGIILGIPATIVGALLLGTAEPKATDTQLYLVLAVVRVFVWALLLFMLTRNSPLPRSRLWLYAMLGSLWSCLLDWPGFHLMMLAPGQIPVC
jgi:hypothetical protein